MKCATIEELRLLYPNTDLCHQLRVSESGCYSWRNRPPSKRKRENARLKVVIIAAHKRTRQTCGPERLQKIIAEQEGVVSGVHQTKRLRKELGLRCCQKRKFKATTNSNHSLPVAENWGVAVEEDWVSTIRSAGVYQIFDEE